MKCGEIRDICGDYALDIQYPEETIILYFNSRQNALNVKKIIEIDESVPNVATVCDMKEVVRCKDCVFWDYGRCEGIENGLIRDYTQPTDFCSYGKRRKNDE